VQALGSFAEAADSLARSYGMLRSEVIRLNKELERSNERLKKSLAGWWEISCRCQPGFALFHPGPLSP
jgi:hypothetical protein